MENQVKNYPALTGGERATPDNVEDEDMITPMNPIELKDKEIENLNKKIEESKTKDAEISHLKETLTKTAAELKATKRYVHISQQKLNFTKRSNIFYNPYAIILNFLFLWHNYLYEKNWFLNSRKRNLKAE